MSIWANWWFQHRWRWKLSSCKDSESLFLHKTNIIKETLTCIFTRGRWGCFCFQLSPYLFLHPRIDSWATGEPELPQAIAQYFNTIQNQRRFSWNTCWLLKPLRNSWAALHKGREGWMTGGLLPISHTIICLPYCQIGQDPHIALWEWPCNALGKC